MLRTHLHSSIPEWVFTEEIPALIANDDSKRELTTAIGIGRKIQKMGSINSIKKKMMAVILFVTYNHQCYCNKSTRKNISAKKYIGVCQ